MGSLPSIFTRPGWRLFPLAGALLHSLAFGAPAAARPPVRLAIYGLAHDHVRGFLPALAGRDDVTLVGIVETDQRLSAEIAERFHLERALFYPTLEALCQARQVDAVATFSSTLDHRRAVAECAARHLPVMMEKPLATDLASARAMRDAANSAGIPVVVNYETTWYPSVHAAAALVANGRLGELTKVVVRDGHSGPAPICSSYFMDWLGDPVRNGGGALMDFGCYGADLVTWLMRGARPESVFAVTQHFQPQVYPKVEDEATIVLTYPHAQAIIEASWNWPTGRKDMEIYGPRGALILPNRDTLRIHPADSAETAAEAPPLAAPHADPVSYLVAVARGELKPEGLSSLETNLIVMEILEAAKESARTGRRVDLPAGP